MVLDTVNVFIKDGASIYIVWSSSTTSNSDLVNWHARLEHIGQDQLHRLTRASFFGSLIEV
jgi:hypothetical protein